MLFLYRSNRSERLVDELAKITRKPLRDPLSPEHIVVQSQGMERWLAMELSKRLGVWANAEFPFPRHMIERVSEHVLGEASEPTAAFSQRSMMWAIAALLPEQLAKPAFAPIANYLSDDPHGAQRIALAERIARVFDDYTVYRPDLLRAWKQGKEQDWEAQLWRALCDRLGENHQAARAERLIAALAAGRVDLAALPERICVFGIASLPPLYIRVLAALSEHVPTHLFVLSPTHAYWGDLRRRDRSSGDGHALLASLGRLGREFQDLLEECTAGQYQEGRENLYVEPGEDCLLHILQGDILACENRGGPGAARSRLPIAASDASIEVHVCHSPMREVEVLHDQLVALLQDETLAPHDIVVMAPDIERYAPVVEAVFGQSGRPFIPYSLSDRKTRSSHEVIDALYALMQTLAGRLPASAVLDLLSLDCIRRRFEITTEEIDTLRTWVQESGIRFGVDEAHRAEMQQPALRENTWRFGLDRLLLGYAMPGNGRSLYAGVLPYDEMEGGATDLLGRFSGFCERLFEQRVALAAPRSLSAWRDGLSTLLGDFVDATGEHAHQHLLVQKALAVLCESAEAVGFNEPLDAQSLLQQLQRTLDERVPARGLLARGVTFCQLVPMRSIPFQVVCLIGMNDEAFPGQSPVLGFDRMAVKRQSGDRSRRDDDRYMFLEALLSARRRFLVSYVGRGIHDNRAMQPSVVVGDLLDSIGRGFQGSNVCVEHRLQAFSPRYFDKRADSRLFSYATAYCDGARALGEERRDPPLLEGPLPASSEAIELTLDELVAWISVPIKTFLRRSLGIHLGDEISPLEEREPVALNNLEAWKIGTRWLSLLLDGVDTRELLESARAYGELPLGSIGRLTFEELLPGVQALAEGVRAYRKNGALDPLSVAIEIDGVRISGNLMNLWSGAHLHATYSKPGRRHELAHFVRHVVLNYVLQQTPRAGYPRESVLLARDKDVVVAAQLRPIANAEAQMRALIALVREAQRMALPFDFEISLAYADALRTGKGAAEALQVAQKALKDRKYTDEYVSLIYPDFEALAHIQGPLGFAGIAERICGPLLDARSES